MYRSQLQPATSTVKSPLHPNIEHRRHPPAPYRYGCVLSVSLSDGLCPFLSPDSCRLAVMANSDPALSMRAPRRGHLAFLGPMCQQAKPRRLTARTGRLPIVVCRMYLTAGIHAVGRDLLFAHLVLHVPQRCRVALHAVGCGWLATRIASIEKLLFAPHLI